MKNLKLPNFNDLGLDIKKHCWVNNNANYVEFRNSIINIFDNKITTWMLKKNIDLSLKKEYEQVLLYWTFINYKKEKQLADELLRADYCWVKPTNSFVDTVYKFDLLAAKNNIVYAIQVKPSKTNTNNFNFEAFKKASEKFNVIPLLAFKEHNKWGLINLLNNEKITL